MTSGITSSSPSSGNVSTPPVEKHWMKSIRCGGLTTLMGFLCMTTASCSALSPASKTGLLNSDDVALLVDKGTSTVYNQLWPWVTIGGVGCLCLVVVFAFGMRLLYRAIVELGEDSQ